MNGSVPGPGRVIGTYVNLGKSAIRNASRRKAVPIRDTAPLIRTSLIRAITRVPGAAVIYVIRTSIVLAVGRLDEILAAVCVSGGRIVLPTISWQGDKSGSG